MSTLTKVEVEDARDAVAGDPDGAAGARPPVAFVVTQSGARANGGVESITQVVERLRGVRPLVVTQAETDFNRRWRDAGARVSVWPMPSLGLASLLKNNARAFRLVRAAGCRVVHCNDIQALWQTAFGARLAGAAVVFNVRNVKPEGTPYGRRWRLARRLSTRQLVLSGEMAEALARRLGVGERGAARARLGHIYSAVDTKKFSPVDGARRAALREKLGVGAGCFAVGVVAAFEPRKAQLEFIRDAIPRLLRLSPASRVYFVGDFDERDAYARRCLEEAKGAGVEASVSFVGYAGAVEEWYRALDAVAVPSRNEGLARCMIEAIACGTPVVSFGVCSAREILQGRGCGLVVESGDHGALAEALASLAWDGERRAALGSAGARAARELFDPAEVVGAYERLYLSLAGD
ncbi:MAG TPA: glycosyltransferase family 4 protein [Pyrinomonadaceae bacterium]|jgi:glycosyltransferase involved in cell wall biosynthesis|nr:glycosyltransferase family 4 protein [Pyrinomonadaceae bacterium]